MIDDAKLLSYLNDHQYVSGTLLGEKLGVSRVAISDRLKVLASQGLPLDVQKSKGYTLQDGVKLLDKAKILERIGSPVKSNLNLSVIQSIDSTNDYLKKQSCLPNQLAVCLAEIQNAGRGRSGNQWSSTPYRNLIMSVSWRFEDWPKKLSGLSLTLGIAAAQCLRDMTDLPVQIKWPNDLYIDGAKIGGILVDVSGEAGGHCELIVGIGVNFFQQDKDIVDADYPIADLHQFGVSLDRNEFISALITGWYQVLCEFEDKDLSHYLKQWRALSMFDGKTVQVVLPKERYVGTVQGVDDRGALLVETNDGLKQVVNSLAKVRLVDTLIDGLVDDSARADTPVLNAEQV
jgi:BirA family biotin operon repressor/biotin-[acetyl-CoA-carboxylase] ligase